ncbi:MAG: DUF294 nucleotidyltransferase-like domain-containing protein [Myxococcota bacterium]
MSADSMLQTLSTRLRAHPPFDRLGDDAIAELVPAMEVRWVDHDEILFEEGQTPVDEIWLVHKGSVRLDRGGELAAMCEPGDLFGARAHLAGRAYVATAVAERDALLYTWPATRFLEWIERYPRLAIHLASGFAAEGPIGQLADAKPALAQQVRTVEPVRDLLSCGPTASVRDAATRMSVHRVGSCLVLDAEARPVGIVTDVDLRRKVVAVGLDVDATSVEAIMSRPVVTVRHAPTVTEATMAMAVHGIHHLVTTEDGTPETRATGMVTNHDLLVEAGENPAVLVRTLTRARTDADLKTVRERLDGIVERYLEAELPIDFVARVAAAVTDQITRRAITRALEVQGDAPAPFVWLALGSQGRREQLLRTDQDNALLFASGPHQDWFLELSKRVVESLHEVGFERCPGDMMASNPRWCLDLGGWKSVFEGWIQVPEPRALMHANIFFDFRALHGEPALEAQLREHVFDSVTSEGRFLPMLANNALANPAPLSFFGGFVLERTGEHDKQFDIKARAMMPFADAARVLSLEHGVREVGTIARYEAVARRVPSLAKVCTAAARAYAPLMEVRTRQGLARHDGGRFVDVDVLDAYDRQRLRHAFRTLAEVQRTLNVRYQTDLIR